MDLSELKEVGIVICTGCQSYCTKGQPYAVAKQDDESFTILDDDCDPLTIRGYDLNNFEIASEDVKAKLSQFDTLRLEVEEKLRELNALGNKQLHIVGQDVVDHWDSSSSHC